MRRKTLRFTMPIEVTPAGLDGIVVRYSYAAVDTDLVGSPEETRKTFSHAIDVAISRSRRISWDVDDAGLVKVLFEIGKKTLSDIFQDKELPEYFKLQVLTNTHPKECPFDPDRIQEPSGAVVELEVGNKIGF
jgi:hypothetical protein